MLFCRSHRQLRITTDRVIAELADGFEPRVSADRLLAFIRIEIIFPSCR
jgi:hypothetical protein